MRVRNLVRVLTLVIILGMAAFFVVISEAETTQDPWEAWVDEQTEVMLNSAGEADEEGLTKMRTSIREKFSALATELKKDIVSPPQTQEQKIAEEIEQKLKNVVTEQLLNQDDLGKLLKNLSKSELIDIDGVVVMSTSHEVQTEGLKELKEEIEKLAADENHKPEELAEKVTALLKNLNIESTSIFDTDDVKVIRLKPQVSTKILKNTEGLKELKEEIEKLAADENHKPEELAEKVTALLKNLNIESTSIFDTDDVKVIRLKPQVSTKILKNTEVDRGLENKIEKLVDKIEELIEKLDEGHSQSTESQQ